MTRHSFKAALLPALLFAIASLCAMPAAATEVVFCSGSTDCVTGKVRNVSKATVTKVVVRQLSKYGCVAVEKSHDKDLPGGKLAGAFQLRMNPKCAYEVAYKTTKGCTGSKVDTITPSNMAAGKTRLSLKSNCGSLWVHKTEWPAGP